MCVHFMRVQVAGARAFLPDDARLPALLAPLFAQAAFGDDGRAPTPLAEFVRRGCGGAGEQEAFSSSSSSQFCAGSYGGDGCAAEQPRAPKTPSGFGGPFRFGGFASRHRGSEDSGDRTSGGSDDETPSGGGCFGRRGSGGGAAAAERERQLVLHLVLVRRGDCGGVACPNALARANLLAWRLRLHQTSLRPAAAHMSFPRGPSPSAPQQQPQRDPVELGSGAASSLTKTSDGGGGGVVLLLGGAGSGKTRLLAHFVAALSRGLDIDTLALLFPTTAPALAQAATVAAAGTAAVETSVIKAAGSGASEAGNAVKAAAAADNAAPIVAPPSTNPASAAAAATDAAAVSAGLGDVWTIDDISEQDLSDAGEAPNASSADQLSSTPEQRRGVPLGSALLSVVCAHCSPLDDPSPLAAAAGDASLAAAPIGTLLRKALLVRRRRPAFRPATRAHGRRGGLGGGSTGGGGPWSPESLEGCIAERVKAEDDAAATDEAVALLAELDRRVALRRTARRSRGSGGVEGGEVGGGGGGGGGDSRGAASTVGSSSDDPGEAYDCRLAAALARHAHRLNGLLGTRVAVTARFASAVAASSSSSSQPPPLGAALEVAPAVVGEVGKEAEFVFVNGAEAVELLLVELLLLVSLPVATSDADNSEGEGEGGGGGVRALVLDGAEHLDAAGWRVVEAVAARLAQRSSPQSSPQRPSPHQTANHTTTLPIGFSSSSSSSSWSPLSAPIELQSSLPQGHAPDASPSLPRPPSPPLPPPLLLLVSLRPLEDYPPTFRLVPTAYHRLRDAARARAAPKGSSLAPLPPPPLPSSLSLSSSSSSPASSLPSPSPSSPPSLAPLAVEALQLAPLCPEDAMTLLRRRFAPICNSKGRKTVGVASFGTAATATCGSRPLPSPLLSSPLLSVPPTPFSPNTAVAHSAGLRQPALTTLSTSSSSSSVAVRVSSGVFGAAMCQTCGVPGQLVDFVRSVVLQALGARRAAAADAAMSKASPFAHRAVAVATSAAAAAVLPHHLLAPQTPGLTKGGSLNMHRHSHHHSHHHNNHPHHAPLVSVLWTVPSASAQRTSRRPSLPQGRDDEGDAAVAAFSCLGPSPDWAGWDVALNAEFEARAARGVFGRAVARVRAVTDPPFPPPPKLRLPPTLGGGASGGISGLGGGAGGGMSSFGDGGGGGGLGRGAASGGLSLPSRLVGGSFDMAARGLRRNISLSVAIPEPDAVEQHDAGVDLEKLEVMGRSRVKSVSRKWGQGSVE